MIYTESGGIEMELKKFIAGVLAASMMLTVGAAAAFAAEGTAADMSSVTVKKIYRVIGEGTSPAETFTLVQQGDGEVTDGDAAEAPALGAITGASFAAGEATTDGVTKNITIELPTYTKVGVYEYKLKEDDTNHTPGVKYFEGTIRLVVSVINGTDGRLRIAAVHTETLDCEGKSDTFTNTYTANLLNVKKIVGGNLGDKTKDFHFTVHFDRGSNANAPTGIRYTLDGTTYKTVSFDETTGTASVGFDLAHGESLNFTNIPAGVTYTIAEDDYTTEAAGGYTTSHGTTEVLDDAAEGRETAVITAGAEPYTSVFFNVKGGIIDTGVIQDNAPYIVLLAVVAAAGAVVVLNKRRRED